MRSLFISGNRRIVIYRFLTTLLVCVSSIATASAEDGRYESAPDSGFLNELSAQIHRRTMINLTVPEKIIRPEDPALALVWAGSEIKLKTKALSIGFRLEDPTVTSGTKTNVEALALYEPGSVVVRVPNPTKYALRGGIRAVLSPKQSHQQTRLGVEGGYELEIFFPHQDSTGGAVFGFCPRRRWEPSASETKSLKLTGLRMAIEGSVEARLVTGITPGFVRTGIQVTGVIPALKVWSDQKTGRSPDAFVSTGAVTLKDWTDVTIDEATPHVSGLRAEYQQRNPAGVTQSGSREQKITIFYKQRSELGLSYNADPAHPPGGWCYVITNQTLTKRTFSDSSGNSPTFAP